MEKEGILDLFFFSWHILAMLIIKTSGKTYLRATLRFIHIFSRLPNPT